MNLTISIEDVKSMFGGDCKIKARLNASDSEVEVMRNMSLGGTELANLPSTFGPKYPFEPVFLAEVLNRDWERKLKTKPEAQNAEVILIDACKTLKMRMDEYDGSSGPKNIEL